MVLKIVDTDPEVAEELHLTMNQRVNEKGVPHPDPHYQGWFYRPWNRATAWEYYRFTSNGELEIHHFCTSRFCQKISPLGSPNFFVATISPGGRRCNNIAG